MEETKLAPCPFCGAGETRVDEQSYWTGMSSKNLSVTLRHWCGTQPDEFVKPAFTIRARDEAQAVETWNRRAPIQPLKGE